MHGQQGPSGKNDTSEWPPHGKPMLNIGRKFKVSFLPLDPSANSIKKYIYSDISYMSVGIMTYWSVRGDYT